MAKARKTEYNGIQYSSERNLCKSLGINYSTFKNRKSKGWTINECVTGIREENIDNKLYSNIFSHNIDELINTISLFPDINTINLIDYENIGNNKMLTENHLNDKNTINIFFFNACIYSNNYYSFIKSSKSINIQVISLEAADQLIDHLLIFHLGALISIFPDKEYRIYSNDSGYRAFISNLNYSNIEMISLTKYAKRGYKYSLGKYILNNQNITESKYFTKNEMKQVLSDFYTKKKLNSHVMDIIINELSRFEFIQMVKIDNKSYFRFCIKDIAKYIKHIDKNID